MDADLMVLSGLRSQFFPHENRDKPVLLDEVKVCFPEGDTHGCRPHGFVRVAISILL
jgi:bifunctional pyridoxal-dependent enzyme with beta-cystathionase and maltose regulon repressor activities